MVGYYVDHWLRWVEFARVIWPLVFFTVVKIYLLPVRLYRALPVVIGLVIGLVTGHGHRSNYR